jgi:uncharacterized membrane protein
MDERIRFAGSVLYILLAVLACFIAFRRPRTELKAPYFLFAYCFLAGAAINALPEYRWQIIIPALAGGIVVAIIGCLEYMRRRTGGQRDGTLQKR